MALGRHRPVPVTAPPARPATSSDSPGTSTNDHGLWTVTTPHPGVFLWRAPHGPVRPPTTAPSTSDHSRDAATPPTSPPGPHHRSPRRISSGGNRYRHRVRVRESVHHWLSRRVRVKRSLARALDGTHPSHGGLGSVARTDGHHDVSRVTHRLARRSAREPS